LKIYEDRDWLFEQYVKQGRTAKDIADDVGVTEMTIYNWLKKFDLLRYKGKGRSLGRRVIKRDW
jgi:transposase